MERIHEPIKDDPTSKIYPPPGQKSQKDDLPARSRKGAWRPCLLGLAGPRLGEILPLRPPLLLLGRAADVQVQIPGEGVSRHHARMSFHGGAWWLEDLGSQNGTRLNRRRARRAMLHDGDQVQIGTSVLCFLRLDAAEERFHRQLYSAALRDPLTRLFNKRYFGERLQGEVAYAARHRLPLSLLVLDVDHFKRVNDRHGHPTGDRALRGISAALRRATRSEDVLARCGGEEFAVLARGLRLDEAQSLAERVRSTVAAMVLPIAGSEALRLTVSIGAAALPIPAPPGGPGATRSESDAALADRLLSLADQALYVAKGAGRDCVRVAAADAS